MTSNANTDANDGDNLYDFWRDHTDELLARMAQMETRLTQLEKRLAKTDDAAAGPP